MSHLVWLNPPASLSPRERDLILRATRVTILNSTSRQDAPPPDWREWLESLDKARWIALPGRPKYLGDVNFLKNL